MLLAIAPLSETLRVTGVRAGGAIGCRLMEMGLIEGALVQVVGRAPLGDPLRVRLGDYELSLRSTEAGLVDVTAI
jgi:ferrous iron transport protein A